MAEPIVVDSELYKIIKAVKEKLPDMGCKNPSWSNAVRTLLDMPHISGRGRFDTCGVAKSRKGTKVDGETITKDTEEDLDI